MRIVVDTSVLVAVAGNESDKPLLVARTEGAEILAPSSAHWEVGNAFSAMLERKRISLQLAQHAVEAYRRISVRFVDVDILHALELAARLGIYAYDAYVIACALDQQCPLLTLDRGLLQAARKAGSEVWEVQS